MSKTELTNMEYCETQCEFCKTVDEKKSYPVCEKLHCNLDSKEALFCRIRLANLKK